MKFLTRALFGLAMAVLSLVLIGVGAMRFMDALGEIDGRQRRPNAVKLPLVNVVTLERIVARPELTAYGEVRSWRTLELRAPGAGRLVKVSDMFRDGEAIAAGTVLYVIDPADSNARRVDAQTSVAESEAETAEALEAIVAAENELKAAQRQLTLRRQSFGRQQALKRKGFATDAEIEAAELSVANAEQSLLNRSQMAITARKRVERAALREERARNALVEAERDVGKTRVSAPFSGLATGVDAALGRLVTPNEKLGELIDPSALEVTFRLSNRQFSRLLDEDGNLHRRSLTASLQLGERTIAANGRVDRVDAVVGAGQSGRLIVGRLDVDMNTVLRSGDFVTVTVREGALEDVAEVPASAASDGGLILVVGADGQLSEVQATIARRQGDKLLLVDVPFGSQVVRERLPRLAAGIQVRASTVSKGNDEPVAAKPPANDTIELEPERREFLISVVNKAKRIPPDRRKGIVAMLSKPRVKRLLVERIEARIAARGS
jgi:membrane fusion protein, multidrug efflux system